MQLIRKILKRNLANIADVGIIAFICWLQVPSTVVSPVLPIVAPIQVTKTELAGNFLDCSKPNGVSLSFEYLVWIPCSKSVGLKNGIFPL